MSVSDGDRGDQRRARSRIDTPLEPSGPLPVTEGRRLSREERKALQERARTRSGAGGGNGEPPRTARPVPRMPQPEPETTVRSRGMVALGTLLIVGLTVLAFAGGRIFGSPPATPTSAAPSPTPLVAAAVPTGVAATPVAAIRPTDVAQALPTPTIAAGRRPVICLDAGHGGPDRGFMRPAQAGLPPMEEANIVLEHAWDLQARLEARGYQVVMTRDSDVAVNADGADVNGDRKTARDDVPNNDRYATLDDIQARIDICNAAKADLLLSIHVNGYSNQNPRGYETWFTRERPFGDRNATIATLAYAHLKEQLARVGYTVPLEEERGVLPDTSANVQMEHSLFKHFIITGPAVPGAIDPSQMPGAIVEALFVSNDGDAAVLASPEGRDAIVTAYENAVVEYFEWFPLEQDDA